ARLLAISPKPYGSKPLEAMLVRETTNTIANPATRAKPNTTQAQGTGRRRGVGLDSSIVWPRAPSSRTRSIVGGNRAMRTSRTLPRKTTAPEAGAVSDRFAGRHVRTGRGI